MRYQEERRNKRKQHGAKKASSNDNDGLFRSREARVMDELAVIFQAGSLQDYTPVVEWESKKVNPLFLLYQKF